MFSVVHELRPGMKCVLEPPAEVAAELGILNRQLVVVVEVYSNLVWVSWAGREAWANPTWLSAPAQDSFLCLRRYPWFLDDVSINGTLCVFFSCLHSRSWGRPGSLGTRRPFVTRRHHGSGIAPRLSAQECLSRLRPPRTYYSM